MPTRSGPDFEVVEVIDVSRLYGRRRALANVSLQARAGDIVGVLGPNGAGKSTLLAILSTLLRPTSGVVRYGSVDAPGERDALRGRIGVLGHDLFLYGDLTARENLDFFARLYGQEKGPVLDAQIDHALDAAGLTDRAGDRVSTFSRGLRQRLAVERALLPRPRLVLLDEPFTGLDDASAGRLRERLGALARDGAIVLMATHDLAGAEGVVSRAVCLNRGRLVPIGDSGGSLGTRYRAALQGTQA